MAFKGSEKCEIRVQLRWRIQATGRHKLGRADGFIDNGRGLARRILTDHELKINDPRRF